MLIIQRNFYSNSKLGGVRMKKMLVFALAIVMVSSVLAEELVIVSDTDVMAYGPLYESTALTGDWGDSKAAVETWEHGNWPFIESEIRWISTAYDTESPRLSTWRLFSVDFELPECAVNLAGNLHVTSDNEEIAYLNGEQVGTNNNWGSIQQYSLTNDLKTGTNTLQFIVKNFAYGTDDPKVNPTGLAFKAVITYDINPDCDGDGVIDEIDKCPGTVEDNPTDGLGTNRWMWDGSQWMKGEIPGKGKGPKESYTIEQIYGCSCEQILERIEEATGLDFEGHHKYGCSKSILEAWIANEYYVGPTYVETVTVPATSGTPVESVNELGAGNKYFLTASGTYRFANWGIYGIADAEWAYRYGPYYPADPSLTPVVPDSDGTSGWVKGEGYYASECGLDLQVDGMCVDWGDFSPEHIYTIDYTGTGNKVSFHIYDNNYADNSGSLSVDIVEDKWVTLW
jgi:hypothetical protein